MGLPGTCFEEYITTCCHDTAKFWATKKRNSSVASRTFSAIDGSAIALGKKMETIFKSVHQGKSSLKLNVRYSLKVAAVDKLQVSHGKRHDSRFSFVTRKQTVSIWSTLAIGLFA
jgi:hypothetical protein